jgi:hypothetical protein
MNATPLLIASLAAWIASPSLAQNAPYPPWRPPEAPSSYDQPGYPQQRPQQPYYAPYDDRSASNDDQSQGYAQPGPPEPQPYYQPYDDRSQGYAQPGSTEPPPNYAPYDDRSQAASYTARPGPPEPPPQPNYAPYDDQSRGAPNAAQIGAPPSPQLVSPSQEGSKSLTTAAEAPLHEMNLVGQKIPPVLLAALADPYASPSPLTCDTLADAVADLTVALGPDFDNLPPSDRKKLTESGGLGLQLANSAAGSQLPFHGYIGFITGSSKHDQLILRALNAGSARRSYLKGLGEAQRCAGPASPRHLAVAAPPVYDGPRRPKYPIR